MNNIPGKLFLVMSYFFISSSVYATVDDSKLMKVTGESSPSCVEYYSVNGELYCSTEALQSKAMDIAIVTYEKQNIKFDNRAWKIAWGKKTPYITTVEYVPRGEDINNWHELVTTQFMPGLQDMVTPKAFAEKFLKGYEESGFKPDATFLKDTPDQVIFEFKITAPLSQIQDEIQVITKGKDGLYAVHYAIKEADMGKEKRSLWLKNLTDSSIK
jgi:hypothetical protein